MASSKLSVSRLINVALYLTPAGARAQSLSTMLLAITDSVIDVVEQYRMYESLSEVALDFSANSRPYLAAEKFFSQQPTPRKLMMGKWARSSLSGGLRGKPVSSSLSEYTDITDGSFSVSIDGAAAVDVTGMDFSAATTMDEVAAEVNAALTGATCKWNANYTRFEFLSSTTGTSSAVSFLGNAATGDPIANNLGCRSTDSGAYVFAGVSAESATSWVNRFDSTYGQMWYGLAVAPNTSLSDANALQFSAAIEAMTNKHMFFHTSQDAACLLTASTTDIAAELKALARRRTFLQYSTEYEFAVLSAAAKLLGVNYNGQFTTLTLMYKQEPAVAAEVLTSSQALALQQKNCNVFVAYDNDTNILQYGTMSDGTYADIVSGTDWLAVTIQNRLYNRLYTTPTKIPQTNAGMQILRADVEAVCSQGVSNGLLAPGVWNSDGFGILESGGYLDKGFYVYSANVDTQDPSDRAARVAPPIQVAAKLAGAIHTVDVIVTVNQ